MNSVVMKYRQEPTLLAVSGGLDSMVMAHLYLEIGRAFAVAHCNFKLRGKASDEDELFVQGFCKKNNIPCFTTPFDTEAVAKARKQSIQLVARNLRYEWLERVRKENGYEWIATAHHLNDSIETALYNFAKGTGIRGLSGIPLENGKIIRPLLDMTRRELEEIQKKSAIPFREDASNAEDKYARNKIRHHIIPVFREINLGLEDTLKKNFKHIDEAVQLMSWAIAQIKPVISQNHNNKLHIDIKQLEQFPAPQTILYELLKDYHFNSDQVAQIWSRRNQPPGAYYYSSTHELLLDRATFLLQIRRDSQNINEVLWFTSEMQTKKVGVSALSGNRYLGRPASFINNSYKAFMDADLLHFPLKLRHWQAGDTFCPLGMNGKTKKVQDFFTDLKLSRAEKEEIWIMENGNGEICWIIGYRLDERYKITEKTHAYWLFQFEEV